MLSEGDSLHVSKTFILEWNESRICEVVLPLLDCRGSLKGKLRGYARLRTVRWDETCSKLEAEVK